MKSTKQPTAAWPTASGRTPAGASATTALVDETPAAFTPTAAVAALRRKKRTSDVLGVVWVHGAMHVASFRRQNVAGKWEATTPVLSFDEFAAALDEAITNIAFTGTEIFFVLAHDDFIHQTENAPSFSERAAAAYLRGRVERIEQEREPMLWVCQRAAAVKREGNYILHLLPVAFYNKLNELLLARRLDLTRILPLHIPLQLALASLTETRDMPLLVAAEAGSSTAVLVGKTGSDILFARTILESWNRDASRVAVEINRSLLYAKQQFGTSVDFLWLLGPGAAGAQAEIAAKCGKGTEVVVESIGPIDWLKAVGRLRQRHAVNLVGSFLRHKRRGRFGRQVAVAACWLGVMLLGIDAWSDVQSWDGERARLMSLSDGEEALRLEQDRLVERNRLVAEQSAFVHTVSDDRVPPVAAKFLAYVASVLPREISLTNFNVKVSEVDGGWDFRLDGTIEADPETAATMRAALRRQLTAGPFRARIPDTSRAAAAYVVGAQTTLQPFALEGSLFEN